MRTRTVAEAAATAYVNLSHVNESSQLADKPTKYCFRPESGKSI